MLTPLHAYPVRPGPQQGESLTSYFFRFFFENGHGVPAEIRHAICRWYERDDRDAFAFLKRYVSSLNIENMIWQSTLIRNNAADKSKSFWWARFDCRGIKLCPVCLDFTDFHFKLWELPIVNACPLHNCKLLKKCAACNQNLLWRSISNRWHCSCGAALKTMRTLEAAPWEIQFSTILANATDINFPSIFDGLRSTYEVTRARFSIDDIFANLKWAYKTRRLFSLRSKYSPRRRFPSYKPRKVRGPSNWEIRLLTGSPELIRSLLLQVLKWEFRYRDELSYHPDPLGGVNEVLKAVALIPQCGLSTTSTLRECVKQVFAKYRVPAAEAGDIYFNPRFYTPVDNHVETAA